MAKQRENRLNKEEAALEEAAVQNLVSDELTEALEIATENRQVFAANGRPVQTKLDVITTKVVAIAEDTTGQKRDALMNEAFDTITKSIASTIPMVCVDPCPHEFSCTIPEDERPRCSTVAHPDYGFRCPIESKLYWTMLYAYLAQLDINVAEPTDVVTAANLAGIQVKKRRFDDLLNLQGYSVEYVKAIDKATGVALMDTKENPMLLALDRQEKREDAILKQFHATREQKEKAKQVRESAQYKTAAQLLSSPGVNNNSASTSIDAEFKEV